jgi:hypothetical protein
MTHLVSTKAELSMCATCALPVLRALDEGMAACVDLVPLAGLAAEVAAIATGHQTYTRLRDGTLAYRDESRLSDPAMASPIHAAHTCPPQPQQLSLFTAPGGNR